LRLTLVVVLLIVCVVGCFYVPRSMRPVSPSGFLGQFATLGISFALFFVGGLAFVGENNRF